MYRGLARLVGMDNLPTGATFADEIKTVKEHYNDYDFFFVHVKPTDAAGEDGDFDRKVKILEDVDKTLPDLLSLNPDVIVVTGDHSTPAMLKGHSWHTVPTMIYSEYCRPDKVIEFSESGCLGGGLGYSGYGYHAFGDGQRAEIKQIRRLVFSPLNVLFDHTGF